MRPRGIGSSSNCCATGGDQEIGYARHWMCFQCRLLVVNHNRRDLELFIVTIIAIQRDASPVAVIIILHDFDCERKPARRTACPGSKHQTLLQFVRT